MRAALTQHYFAEALADAFLDGPADWAALCDRGAQTLGARFRWMNPLVTKILAHGAPTPTDSGRQQLVELILSSRGFHEAWDQRQLHRVHRRFLPQPTMAVSRFELPSPLPALASPGELAQWLGISVPELESYADLRGMNHRDLRFCHYHYQWIAKHSGGFRLIEAPKARLKSIQQQILREILDPVPPHVAAQGFRRGHSCLTHAQLHVGKQIVIKMDLQNFFASVAARRVHGIFQALGYPLATSRYLTALCTNRIPVAVNAQLFNQAQSQSPTQLPNQPADWAQLKQLQQAHLPQGAPTSPALANLAAWSLDRRLAALAQNNDAVYSRYADDLAFSGGDSLRRRAVSLTTAIAVIAMDEGFVINFHKTRRMHASHQQRLTGIIVNRKLNVHREEYEQLKAILHNAQRDGLAAQNREGHRHFLDHLRGRISHVKAIHPERGVKLESQLARITSGV